MEIAQLINSRLKHIPIPSKFALETRNKVIESNDRKEYYSTEKTSAKLTENMQDSWLTIIIEMWFWPMCVFDCMLTIFVCDLDEMKLQY